MVIKGRSRSNGVQLGYYLLTKAENENIQILEVAGMEDATPEQLRDTLYSMGITSELTKGDKGLYHAQINPAYGDDIEMDWAKAADILEKELGLHDQRRVIVLHTKKGRTHAHVAWERYDHERGILISDSFSRLAQDRARKEMERVFEHTPTPNRNRHRPEMKNELSDLWQASATGRDFIEGAEQLGYVIATESQRRPFMVIDGEGVSFDLVRQLKGVDTKGVREKLRGEKLIGKAEGFALSKSKRTAKELDRTQEKMIDKIEGAQEVVKVKQEKAKLKIAIGFAENRRDVLEKDQVTLADAQQKTTKEFTEHAVDIGKPEPLPTEKIVREFAKNRDTVLPSLETEQKQRTQNPKEVHNKNELSADELAAIEKEAREAFRKIREDRENDRGIDFD